MLSFPRRGVYMITDCAGRLAAEVLANVEAGLQGGVAVVQYRDKQPLDALGLARRLTVLCHRYQAPLLVNDDVELAAAAGADGVHLGRDDGDVAAARRRLGPGAIIGVSCYNDVSRAAEMLAHGADYAAFGRFFASNSKPMAAPAQLETLMSAKGLLKAPIVAIGGVTPENGGLLLAAGADVLAVIGGLSGADARRAAERYAGLFAQGRATMAGDLDTISQDS